MNQEKKEELKEFFLAAVDCDGYQEWLEHIFQWHTIQENNAGKKYLYNPILKQTLEELLEKKESITLEELNEYMKYSRIQDSAPIRTHYIELINLYEDLFKNDPQFNFDLLNKVKNAFDIQNEEQKKYRLS